MTENLRISKIFEVSCTLCGSFSQVFEKQIPKDIVTEDEKVLYVSGIFEERGWKPNNGTLCSHCHKMLEEDNALLSG